MQSQPLETVSWYFTAERMPALMPNAIPKTNPAVAVVSGEGKPVALKSEACYIEPKANALKAWNLEHTHMSTRTMQIVARALQFKKSGAVVGCCTVRSNRGFASTVVTICYLPSNTRRCLESPARLLLAV